MSEVRDERPVYIYVLRSPVDGAIRYVGKSINPQNRLRMHLWEAARGRFGYRSNWMRKVLAAGQKPILEILEEANADTWPERERWWIAHYRAAGADLVNVTNGGEGALGRPTSAETRARISSAQKGKRARPETVAKRIATLREIHQAVEVPIEDGQAERCDYILLSPQNEEIAVRNLAAFCRRRGFDQSLFGSVLRGERQHAYQWRIRRPADPPFPALDGPLNAYRRGGLEYILQASDGREILVHNLTEFCRLHGLGERSLRSALSQPGRTSQGWRIRRPGDPPFEPIANPHRIQKRRDAEYIVTTPSGEVIRVRVLRTFCQENNLKEWWFHQILRGRRESYEGWRIRHPEDIEHET